MLILGASTRQPRWRPRMSTGMVRPTSEAVVSTGVAPSRSATRPLHSLAPPTWPESTGMTNCAASSTTITPGSSSLLLRCGAIRRTTAPSDTKNTSWSKRCISAAICAPMAPSKICSGLAAPCTKAPNLPEVHRWACGSSAPRRSAWATPWRVMATRPTRTSCSGVARADNTTLGKVSARTRPPRSPVAHGSLPPGGAFAPSGGRAARTRPPRSPAAHGSLPPGGAFAPSGGRAALIPRPPVPWPGFSSNSP